MNKKIIEILSCIARGSPDEQKIDLIKSFAKNMDANYDKILCDHKVQLLFFKHLIELGCFNLLPNEYKEKYSNQLFYLQFKYQEYLQLVSTISELFAQNGVDYAILKGFSFICDIYCSKGVVYRHFNDVDILVGTKHIDRVEKILKSEGMVQGKFDGVHIKKASRADIIYWRVNSHQLHEFVAHSQYSNISPMFIKNIDVNTTIFEGGCEISPIATSEILTHTMEKNIASNINIKCLDYVYGLIQLCYHFYKDTRYEIKKETHDQFSLIKFCDIFEYIQKYSSCIDWNYFVRIVKEWNIVPQIGFSLSIVFSFYGNNDINSVLKEMNYIEDSRATYDWNKLLI